MISATSSNPVSELFDFPGDFPEGWLLLTLVVAGVTWVSLRTRAVPRYVWPLGALASVVLLFITAKRILEWGPFEMVFGGGASLGGVLVTLLVMGGVYAWANEEGY